MSHPQVYVWVLFWFLTLVSLALTLAAAGTKPAACSWPAWGLGLWASSLGFRGLGFGEFKLLRSSNSDLGFRTEQQGLMVCGRHRHGVLQNLVS